jgi:YgiT-type zinc finger domain-containing protein
MSAPSQCPLCGGTVEPDREVDQVVREGDDVALVRVRADVCLDCHEVLLHPGMATRMTEAADALRRGAAGPVVGRVYRTGT